MKRRGNQDVRGVLFHGRKPERGTDDPGDSKRRSQESGRVYADSERTDMGTSGERKGKMEIAPEITADFREIKGQTAAKGGTSCSRRFS